MSAADVANALMARCATLNVSGLPVAYPEVAFTPPSDGKYLSVSLFHNAPAWEGLSSGKLAQGLLQVSVFWPKNVGVIGAHAAADSVCAHFAKGLNLFHGNTAVRINREPVVASPIIEDDRLQIPVTISWVAA